MKAIEQNDTGTILQMIQQNFIDVNADICHVCNH